MTAGMLIEHCTAPLHPLDDPVRSSLRGAHARFAVWSGRVARYDREVAGFLGHPPRLDTRDWADVATLAGPAAEVSLRGAYVPPPGWEVIDRIGSVQLDGSAFHGEAYPPAVPLSARDVPRMLDLVARTAPGPFRPRTIEMGTYLGVFDRGARVAMAGERMHPIGWTEISAVCTDPAHRNRGLATALVGAVADGIRRRGETPFLHARADNVAAIRLYEALGFVLRQRSVLTIVRTPAAAADEAAS